MAPRPGKEAQSNGRYCQFPAVSCGWRRDCACATRESTRGFRIGWQGASRGSAAVIGALSGAALYATLDTSSLESWGWRVPFLLGLLIAPVGLYIRRHLDETLEARAHDTQPLTELFASHKSKIERGVLSIVASTVGMYLVVFFMPTFLVRVLHLPTSLSLMAGCVSGATMMVMCLVSGLLADRMRAQTDGARLDRAHDAADLSGDRAHDHASGRAARAVTTSCAVPPNNALEDTQPAVAASNTVDGECDTESVSRIDSRGAINPAMSGA
ncbi:MFS transporter [Paraburkholderia tropica]|uniref:MFS transporter n=1 Tax=Paraburkholderia tropica TaxID=92647 RepID=UPI002AAF638E|nr:MFS transporter [Paraburkholderia tropica]